MINREKFAILFTYYLEQRRLSLKEFLDRINDTGVSVSYQQAYKWKRGLTLPNALQLIAICTVLKIDNVSKMLSDEVYSKITASEKNIVKMPIANEVDEDKISHRQLPVILQKASAGYGQYVDDADMEMVYVKESVPKNASFGIYVSGDSMEPRFHNGDLVWVEKRDTLNSGDIGVFYLDGDIFIKKLEYGNDAPCLKSLNRKYKKIPIGENSVFTVWGKVLDY